MNTDEFMKCKKTRRWQSLSEDVCKFVLSQNIGDLNVAVGLVLANHVIQDINMLGVLMMFGITNKAYSRLIVRVEQGRVFLRRWRFQSSLLVET
jgi:hypothetical protein